MADIPSTGPDNYVELDQQKVPSHYEQKVGPEYGKLSFEIGGVIFDMKKNLITILDSPEAKENSKRERDELKSEISGELVLEEKEQFIQQLNKSKNQDIQNSIENGIIKTFEIPGSEKIAISLNGNNIDYIYNLDGTEYFDFQWRRNDWLKYSAYIGVIRKYYTEINEDGVYYLEKGDKKIDSFSEEGLKAYYWIAEHIEGLNDWLEEVGKMDWDKIIDEENKKKSKN